MTPAPGEKRKVREARPLLSRDGDSKLAWSEELGRMMLVRADGTINDVGFGDVGKGKGDWWAEEVRSRH